MKITKFIGLFYLFAATLSASLQAGQYFQDFSTAGNGAITFSDGSQLFSTHLGSVAAVVASEYSELQLTQLASGTRTAFLLPDLDPATPIYAFSAKWNSQVYGNFPNAGDGFSFNFGNLGSTNLLTNTSQEAGYGVGLAFCAHTHTNNNPGFYIRINGATVASVTNNPATVWGSGNVTRHFFEVDWNYTNGLSVSMDGQSIFSNVATANFTPTLGDRFVWAARTGAQTQEVRLDNIVVVTGGNLVSVATSSPFADAMMDAGHPAANAFDGNKLSEWTTLANKGFVGATVSPARKVVAYAITSAPTARNVDPKNWILEGSNDGGATWQNAGNGRGIFLNDGETRAHLATNFVSYGAYRLNVVTNYGGASTSVGELRFYEVNRVAPVNVFCSLSQFDYPVRGVTVSADGRRISAVFGSVFAAHSMDFGATWFPSYQNLSDMTCISSSADGRTLVAAGSGSRIVVANETFCNEACFVWNGTDAPVANWVAIASSTNGVRHIATSSGAQGRIYMSTNSGMNWFATGPTNWWLGVASSADGTKLFAGTMSGPVYRSLDSGATWTSSGGVGPWISLASSADGTKVAAACGGIIYLSTDSGASWHPSSSPFMDWYSVASSADGTKLIAGAADNEGVYTSADSGATWQQVPYLPPSPGAWDTASSSADGSVWAVGSSDITQLAVRHPIFVRMQHAGPNVALLWSANQTGMGVEQNRDFTTPNWVTATNAVSIVGHDYQMLFPATNAPQFFRLTPR